MDIELYYQEKGNGEPFIMLHGNGENSDYFCNQIEYFSKNYHVIAIDTRGHGKSPRGEAPFTIAQFADDLYDFMMQKELKNAIILGFSDGANIAMKFAMKYPDMLRTLILNGGNLNAKGVKSSTQVPIEIGYKIASFFADKSPEAKKNAEMLGLMVNDPNIKTDELSKITVPTLVICGTNDMIKESHTREIADNIMYSKLMIIKGNHFVANKNPEEFNKAVDVFLTNRGNVI
ncbi:MAG: alpha/beta hydrolase [Lachnospiraceae bacterium]|nr:alpha/beta hydrolase [Lachnospiraceae bacterium]